MRTVKQVSELTGISVRTLHYYDEIGLLAPSKVTEAGYRMYDDEALQGLQQILFFRELDFPLKDIRSIMLNPAYDKGKAFGMQKKLIQEKRDRLDGLSMLLDKLIEGENCMSFKEFDMSGYAGALEEFISTNTDVIRKYGGDLDELGRVLETLQSDGPGKAEIAKIAIRQYGSIDRYTEAMKKNLANFPEIMEKLNAKKDMAKSYVDRSNEVMRRLTADLTKDVSSDEIQQIARELIVAGEAYTTDIELDMGDNYWGLMADCYLSNPTFIEATDKEYGSGAASFIGRALTVCVNR